MIAARSLDGETTPELKTLDFSFVQLENGKGTD
jgi:hypothetical protein